MQFMQKEDLCFVSLTDTEGMLTLAHDARKRGANRQAYIRKLEADIDPNGMHLLAWQMMHNGEEWRTMWLVKMTGTDEPLTLWLDVSFSAFEDVVFVRTAPRGKGE